MGRFGSLFQKLFLTVHVDTRMGDDQFRSISEGIEKLKEMIVMGLEQITAAVEDLQGKVAAQTTVIDSAATMIDGLQDAYAAAIKAAQEAAVNAGVTQDQVNAILAPINQVGEAIVAGKDKLTVAMQENTAPAPVPTEETSSDTGSSESTGEGSGESQS